MRTLRVLLYYNVRPSVSLNVHLPSGAPGDVCWKVVTSRILLKKCKNLSGESITSGYDPKTRYVEDGNYE